MSKQGSSRQPLEPLKLSEVLTSLQNAARLCKAPESPSDSQYRTFCDQFELFVTVFEYAISIIGSRPESLVRKLMQDITSTLDRYFHQEASQAGSDAEVSHLQAVATDPTSKPQYGQSSDQKLLDSSSKPAKRKSSVLHVDSTSQQALTAKFAEWHIQLRLIREEMVRDVDIVHIPRKHVKDISRLVWSRIWSTIAALEQANLPDCGHEEHQLSVYLMLGAYTWHSLEPIPPEPFLDLLISIDNDPFWWEEVRIYPGDLESGFVHIAYEKHGLEKSEPDPVQFLCDFLGVSTKRQRHSWMEGSESTLWSLRTLRKDDSLLPVIDENNRGELISFDVLIQNLDVMSNANSIAHEAKLMLAVILSHSLLHLCAEDKLQKRWPRKAIYFLNIDGATMTRPLFRTSTGFTGQEIKEDTKPFHLFPTLVGFAIMLLEIHESERIQSMVGKDNIVSNFRSDFYRLRSAFNEKKNDMTSLAFRKVIELCLKPSFKLDSSSDICEFQNQIYDQIVKPFENELESSHGAIEQLDLLDLRACTLTLQTGRSFIVQENKSQKLQPVLVNSATRSSSDSQIHQRDVSESRQSLHTFNKPMLDTTTHTTMKETSPEQGYSISYNPSAPARTHEEVKSDEWISSFSLIIAALRDEARAERRDEKIEIAILDTGVDLNYPTIKRHNQRITRVCNFLGDLDGPGEDDKSGDTSGHGTSIACMVLEWAPLATISIGKISDRKTDLDRDTVRSVARGLQAARSPDRWKADIIIMSLGFDEETPEIEKEIKDACHNDILVFATASNDGPRRSPTYPASDHGVFGIYSTTGFGKWSDSNPKPQAGKFNFAILGENLDGSWCSKTMSRLSGTSYSTAIAAAFVASILSWSQCVDKLRQYKDKIKSYVGITSIFQLMSEEKDKMSLIEPSRLFDGDFTYSIDTIARKLESKRRLH